MRGFDQADMIGAGLWGGGETDDQNTGRAFHLKGTAWAETKGCEATWHIRGTTSYPTWLPYRLFVFESSKMEE